MSTKSGQELEAARRDATIDFGARLHEILEPADRELVIDYIKRTDGYVIALVYPAEPKIQKIMQKVQEDWIADNLLNRLCYLYGVPYEAKRRDPTTDRPN